MNLNNSNSLPVIIAGGGPIGLITALGLAFYKIPFVLLEANAEFSSDTKAGTLLSRTLEILHRYGVSAEVLSQSLRVDEIGEIERASNKVTRSVKTEVLQNETQFPFVVNLPQHHLEPILGAALQACGVGEVCMHHRLINFEDCGDRISVNVETPEGAKTIEGCYLLACDGGRSQIRNQLDINVKGISLAVRYMLVDVKVDLDVANPRDYPYLTYFSDPQEWMVLIRQPHCWRFLYPWAGDRKEPTPEELQAKVSEYIGEVSEIEILNHYIYRVHHRVAEQWIHNRVILMGDAAHLITPMWALGLSTGALDASNLPWRLAWVMRGWADPVLLEGYAREQRPVALEGAGEMAEAARNYMSCNSDSVQAMTDNNWGNAMTRTMLGVRLDSEGTGDWSMVCTEAEPSALRVGDRIPDAYLQSPSGKSCRLHDLVQGRFLALYFCDVRRQPDIPTSCSPALSHFAVSRWDAPFDSGLRERSLLDVGNTFKNRAGFDEGTLVLVRPDEHIAAIVALGERSADDLYQDFIGQRPPSNDI